MDTDPDCRTDRINNLYNPHWSNQRTVTYTDEDDPELQKETRRKKNNFEFWKSGVLLQFGITKTLLKVLVKLKRF
jgi:hypothetical protein